MTGLKGEDAMEMTKLVCMTGLAVALAACGGGKKEEPVTAVTGNARRPGFTRSARK